MRAWVSVGAMLLASGCGGVSRSQDAGAHSSGGASTKPDDGAGGGSVTAERPRLTCATTAPGSSGELSQPWRSSGCSKPLSAQHEASATTQRYRFVPQFVEQTGATLAADHPEYAGRRQILVRVPENYDPCQSYPIVYLGQRFDTLGEVTDTVMKLFDPTRGGDDAAAIYVIVRVPENEANPGYYDDLSGAESQEWEAFETFHSFVEGNYCVDNNRIFVAGGGSGGWLAQMWGCYFGGLPSPPLDSADVQAGRSTRKFSPRWAIRGRISASGQLPPQQPLPCNGPAAGLWVHDQGDNSTPFDQDVPGFERALAANGCQGDFLGSSEPWQEGNDLFNEQQIRANCARYTACPAETLQSYPLVFCTTYGASRTTPNISEGVATRFLATLTK